MKFFKHIIDKLFEGTFHYRCQLCNKRVIFPGGNSEIETEIVAMGLCIKCWYKERHREGWDTYY